MKSFTKIQNEKDITVKQYVDEQNATNKIYTTFTPEGGTEGEDYAVAVPGLKTLEVGTSLTIKPHVNNKNTSTTLTVNDFGLKYFRRSLSGDYINTSNFTFPANMIKAGFPIKVFYGDNIWLTEQAKPTVGDLSGVLKITNGGTGGFTAEKARTNLGAAATVHTHTTSDITDLSTVLDTKANVADVLTQDNADSRYLKLSGGTVNGNITMGPQGDIKIEGNSGIPGGTNVEAGKITRTSFVAESEHHGGAGGRVYNNLQISSNGNISIRPNGYVGFNNHRLVNIADAVNEQDAINKRYVDNNFLSKNDGGTVSGDVTLSEGKNLIISGKTKGGQDIPVSLSSSNEIVLVDGVVVDEAEEFISYEYYEEVPNPNGSTATAWETHELNVSTDVAGEFLEGQTFTINGTVISAYDFITGAVEAIGPCTQCSYVPPSGIDISQFTDGRRLCNNTALDENTPILAGGQLINDGYITVEESAGEEEEIPEEVTAQSASIVESEEVGSDEGVEEAPDEGEIEEPGEIAGILEPAYDLVTSTYQATTFLNINQGISVDGESSFNGHAIHAVGWPTHPQDAARKDYVDTSILEAMNSTPSMEAITVYKPCRIIVGSSAYGWDESKVDYLCDGVDDQVEINEAINFIVASSVGSITEKEIVLLDGVYNLTSGINIILDNVTIRGNGNSTIFKRMYSEDTTSRGILDISGNAGCKICDLSFDNNISEYNFFYNKTLSLNSCSDITISNCNFTNSRTAVSLIGSTHCKIINNSFSNNGTSIDIQNNGYNIVANNYVYGNNNNGIFIVSCNNNNINGNIVENCKYGITINNTSSSVATGNNISDNTCNNNKTGISVSSNNSSYSFSTISGNVCNDCSYYGISISSHGNTVTGNTCCNYGERGININNGNANTITGNTCIRGSGTASDYSSTQYTIYNYGENNLICANNIMGKDCYNQGTNATIVNNKYQ